MIPTLDTTIALLRRTPASLDALLRDLPEQWTSRNEGDGSWTALEIVAHLANAERTDWLPRIRTILDHGETRDFPPFDREGFRREMQGKSGGEILDDFAAARAHSLEELSALHLQPEDMMRRGRHPAFGSVTLGQLLATWAAHDANHLHQLARVLAHQYAMAVGPWKAFLGVMHCDGHSVPA